MGQTRKTSCRAYRGRFTSVADIRADVGGLRRTTGGHYSPRWRPSHVANLQKAIEWKRQCHTRTAVFSQPSVNGQLNPARLLMCSGGVGRDPRHLPQCRSTGAVRDCARELLLDGIKPARWAPANVSLTPLDSRQRSGRSVAPLRANSRHKTPIRSPLRSLPRGSMADEFLWRAVFEHKFVF